MNKRIHTIVLSAFALALLVLPGYIRAESDSVTESNSVSQSEDASSTTSGEAKEPTRWGLFFLGIKERVSLLTTFDPVARAEKALKFAEERAKIAEKLAEKADDPQVQERLDKILRRSEELEEKAERVKDTLLDNPDARKKLLLKNLLNFKEHKEEVFSKLEEKLSPEQLEKLKELKVRSEDKSKTLLNALENENLPEDVREHLEQVKARIEEHKEEAGQFQEDQKVLLDRIKSGDETAKEELKTLREDRAAEIKQNLDERKTNLQEKADDRPAAERRLKQLENREEIIKDNMEQRRERVKPSPRPILPLQERPVQ